MCYHVLDMLVQHMLQTWLWDISPCFTLHPPPSTRPCAACPGWRREKEGSDFQTASPEFGDQRKMIEEPLSALEPRETGLKSNF